MLSERAEQLAVPLFKIFSKSLYESFDYSMKGVLLSKSTAESDLGVIITDDLKPTCQCAKAAQKALQALGKYY